MPRRPNASTATLTATEIGRLWGISKQAVANWHKKAGCPRNPDGTYSLPDVIAWRESHWQSQLEDARASRIDEADGLGRLRDEKAKLAKLDRLERERVLCRRDHIHEGLARIAGLLREVGEQLGREYGREAQRLLNDALGDMAREMKGMFPEDGLYEEPNQ